MFTSDFDDIDFNAISRFNPLSKNNSHKYKRKKKETI